MCRIQLLRVFIIVCFGAVQHQNSFTYSQEISKLPDDLNTIQEKDLEPILSMLGDAEIIGVSEGTHGMIEPFIWRNALIKYLVNQERISVIALESGLVESRLIYDYVNGSDINIDSALTNGLQCGFGNFKQNRELLIWLRDYNSTKSEDKKIHIYGFDIPGCAPNPIMENAMSGFNYVLEYLRKVNLEKSLYYSNQLNPFLESFRIRDNEEDGLKQFTDIDSLQWNQLRNIQASIKADLISNSENYVLKASQSDYDWAIIAVNGAKQNIDFLYQITHDEIKHAPREKGLFENVQWLKEKENNKSILLFSHLAHLAKEIHMKEGKLAYPMCGEYLGEKYGDNYKLIGNFYGVLDYFDEGKLEFKINKKHIEKDLLKIDSKNYFFEINKAEKKWKREYIVGKPSSGGNIYMIPAQSIDIIFFNKTQTWFDAERYK